MRAVLFVALASILLVACGGREPSSTASAGSQTSADDEGDAAGAASGSVTAACAYPPNANTLNDASGIGCNPEPPGQLCAVSNGAVVLVDGGVANGTESCSSLCGASQYELACTSGSGGPGAIPAPDSSLDCTIIPIPTPSSALFYCCPCGT